MIDLPRPQPLFNLITSSVELSPVAVLAGPFGLIAFLPLIPVVWLVGRRWPRTALIVGSLAWLLPTLQVASTLVLLASLVVSGAYLQLLAAGRRNGVLGQKAMIALVWIGLNAMALPLWWQSQHWWYPSPMAVLHNAGFAYFLLRLIAWGVDLARDPHQPLRPVDTACWLLYPPCMRLGPVMLRRQFLERFDAWTPGKSADWLGGLRRFGLFVLGVAGIAVIGKQIPRVPLGVHDFFTAPAAYEFGELLRVFYFVPIQVYVILWTYNELAAAISLWVGLRVDNNFDWLPRATSIRDFWHRWHVTMGAWLRDYVYIPLGGNRRPVVLTAGAAFGYCAIWHGAAWSFVAWGGAQIVAIVIERRWAAFRKSRGWHLPAGPLWTGLCWLLTMHYQIATIAVFVDFQHAGTRLLPELARRLIGAA